MKIAGIVSDFSNDTGRGTILTEFDESLEFNISEWYNVTILPKAGCIVSFYKKGTDAFNICIESSMEPIRMENSSNNKSKLQKKYNNNGLTKSKDNLNTLFEKSEEKLYTLKHFHKKLVHICYN